MLSEHFAISTLGLSKSSGSELRDSNIQIYDHKSLSLPVRTFKKSSTATNALAVSPSHIYAAQAQKATIHVYSREKGTQEAVVALPERFRCIHFAGDSNDGGVGILIIGSELGNLILWEVASGRQIFSARSHLRSITCIAVDPSYTNIITGSDDSNIQVWSIQTLISFSPIRDGEPSPGPTRTLSRHRAGITSLVIGHSSFESNIVISASQDKTLIVWNYNDGSILRTILVASTPLCLALDPADRALFIGLDDGSIQMVDFFGLETNGTSAFGKHTSDLPFQAQESDRWTCPSQQLGSVHAITVLYEGTCLLSCHESGKVVRWSVASGTKSAYDTTMLTLEHPVTNIQSLHPLGFPNVEHSRLKLSTVLKPRFDPSFSQKRSGGAIPPSFSITAQLTGMVTDKFEPALSVTATSENYYAFACSHPSFPDALLQYHPENAVFAENARLVSDMGNGGRGESKNQNSISNELESSLDKAQAAAQKDEGHKDVLLSKAKEQSPRENKQRKASKQQGKAKDVTGERELSGNGNGFKLLNKGDNLARPAGHVQLTKEEQSEIHKGEISSTDDGGPDSTDDSSSDD